MVDPAPGKAELDRAGWLVAAHIQSDAIETAKIKDANVTAAKLAANSVETAKIKDANVTAAKLAADAVTNVKVAAGAAIAGSKIAPDVTKTIIGVAAGYKIARGTHTPTTGSDTVVTGLSTVVAAVASLKGAPTLTHMLVAADIGNQAGAPAAGSIYIKSYKPTTSTDVTPTTATTPWGAVDWIAIGT